MFSAQVVAPMLPPPMLQGASEGVIRTHSAETLLTPLWSSEENGAHPCLPPRLAAWEGWRQLAPWLEPPQATKGDKTSSRITTFVIVPGTDCSSLPVLGLFGQTPSLHRRVLLKCLTSPVNTSSIIEEELGRDVCNWL